MENECLGYELRELAINSQKNKVNKTTKNLIDKFSEVSKFKNWIVPKYNIKIRWQQVRKVKGKKGQGQSSMEVVPSDFSQQMKRMLLLLGASEAGNKEGNLNEFTSILDTMRNNKKLSKKGYQILLQRFKD